MIMIEPGFGEILDATRDPKFLEDAADENGMQALFGNGVENNSARPRTILRYAKDNPLFYERSFRFAP